MIQWLRTLGQQCKLLVSLHNQRQARALADAIVLMGGGRVLAYQPVEEFFSRPANELRDIMRTLLIRLQAAGEIDPAVSLEYCCTAIFSAVVGGLIGLCFTAECGIQSGLLENLKMLLHRTLQVQQ